MKNRNQHNGHLLLISNKGQVVIYVSITFCGIHTIIMYVFQNKIITYLGVFSNVHVGDLMRKKNPHI